MPVPCLACSASLSVDAAPSLSAAGASLAAAFLEKGLDGGEAAVLQRLMGLLVAPLAGWSGGAQVGTGGVGVGGWGGARRLHWARACRLTCGVLLALSLHRAKVDLLSVLNQTWGFMFRLVTVPGPAVR